MVETREGLNLQALRPEIGGSLEAFAAKLFDGFGENIESITVTGSSLTEDFRPGKSDINTVLVLKVQKIESLKKLASMANKMHRKKIATPLLMTADYIDRSRDVFGVELLDFQLTHAVVFGPDPFETLTIAKGDVRLQCEREFKATLIRLRQGYIASAANKRLVRDILISAAVGILPLLRAMLWLKDVERPQLSEETLSKAAEHFSIDTEPLRAVLGWRREKQRLSEDAITAAFESTYQTAEKLSVIVDELKV